MCVNKTWIINQRGRRILVKCGHCSACLQEKAIKRSNRIRAHVNRSDPRVCLFVTLTYNNKSVPYFNLSDLKDSPIYRNFACPSYLSYFIGQSDPSIEYGIARRFEGPQYADCKTFRSISIYRDVNVRWVHSRATRRSIYTSSLRYNMIRRYTQKLTHLSDIHIPTELCYGSFKRLNGQSLDKIGVCYYPDVQNFIKNLRNVLQRNFRIFDPVEFYSCSEYGPTTCRPHFHLLFFVRRSQVSSYKVAIGKAWSFDSNNRTLRSIEVGVNPASYVSSYVNCDSTIPTLFKAMRSLSPHSSFSRGFGLGLEHFQISYILKAIERGDLRVPVLRLREGRLVKVPVLLPKYVINQYFPKFKGYYTLTSHEIESILLRPSLIFRYYERIHASLGDCSKIYTLLRNKLDKCTRLGVSPYDYALAGSRVWSVYSSNVLADFYNSIDCLTSNFYAYDNIKDFYNLVYGYDEPKDFDSLPCFVHAPTLEPLLDSLPSDFSFEDNPNKFPLNLGKDKILRDSYNSYSKDKKIRNFIYSQTLHV